MFKTIKLKTNNFNYSIKIGKGSFKKIINDLKKTKIKKFILIDSCSI